MTRSQLRIGAKVAASLKSAITIRKRWIIDSSRSQRTHKLFLFAHRKQPISWNIQARGRIIINYKVLRMYSLGPFSDEMWLVKRLSRKGRTNKHVNCQLFHLSAAALTLWLSHALIDSGGTINLWHQLNGFQLNFPRNLSWELQSKPGKLDSNRLCLRWAKKLIFAFSELNC